MCNIIYCVYINTAGPADIVTKISGAIKRGSNRRAGSFMDTLL